MSTLKVDAIVDSSNGNTATINSGTPVSTTSTQVVKAWVNFNGTTNTGGNCDIRASYNVTDVDDNGTGDYTVNFTTAFSDANYCIVTMASPAASSDINNFLTTRDVTYLPTTSNVRLANRRDSGNLLDSPQCNVAIFR
jgi:hypothetical protein